MVALSNFCPARAWPRHGASRQREEVVAVYQMTPDKRSYN